MTTVFARAIEGIPVVSSSAERDLLFPVPTADQRVQIRATGEIQRYYSGQWQTDQGLPSLAGEPAIVSGRYAAGNPLRYGAVKDGRRVLDASMTAGLPTLTSPAAGFTPAVVGLNVSVDAAGAAGVALLTTIIAYVDASHVTLAANATNTVAAVQALWGTDNTVAFQAAADFCSFGNTTTGIYPFMKIDFGGYLVLGKVRVKNYRFRAVGDGNHQTAVFYTHANGCFVYDATTAANPTFSAFAIYGSNSSGHALDFSAPIDFTYNARISDMLIYAGKNAIWAPQLFSARIEDVFAESATDHIFRVRCGPSVSWHNTYASRCPLTKAGYRLTGTIRMYSCNGVNAGGYWLVAGSRTAGADGFQADFPGLVDDYPDVELHGCNVEAWTVTGIYATNGYQQLKMAGGSIVRALAGTYHSVIRTALGSLAANGYIELDSVRGLISGGAATAANVYADASDSLLLKNDKTGFTGVFSAAFALTYPAVVEQITGDVFGDKAKNVSAIQARRITADVLRYSESVLADGATNPDITGKSMVITANTAPTTILTLPFLTGAGIGQDNSRNGLLFLRVEDTNTTIKHQSGATYDMSLLGGQDYVATKGDVLVFAYSGFNNGVHTGWVQVGQTRTQGRITSTGWFILNGTTSTPGGANRYIGTGGSASVFWFNVPTGGNHTFAVNDTSVVAITATTINPNTDNVVALGSAIRRWTQFHAMSLTMYGNLNFSSGVLQAGGTQVVSTRRTGWAAWTGTATRTTFATGTATLANVAEALKALMDDLTAHGLIGP